MADRKVFADSVTPLPAHPVVAPMGLMVHAAKAENRDERMTILFSLEPPTEARETLEQRVARGEVASADELAKYSVKPADFDSLAAWLRSEGFTIKDQSADRTALYAEAPVSQIEKSLGVTMVRVTKGGLTYTAAQNAPSLPSDVGAAVHAIIGLQPFRQAHKHLRRRPPRAGNRANGAALHANSAEVQNAPPYLVAEILKAYDADGLPVTGAGQTIAILIDTFPQDQDLVEFWKRNHVTTQLSQVEKINVKGGPLPPREGEETLDVEWSSGIAPGAKVRVYASGSLAFVDLDMALDRIIADVASHPGMRQLSISLGLGETFMGGPQGEVATQHQKFLRLAAAGVNVFVSSGDAGSNPDDTGHGSGGPLQAEYEASDSAVIGVGGTSLALAQNGTVQNEGGWAGSGGGRSIFFARPAWQKGAGLPSGNRRLVPDVSLAADPEFGAFVFVNGESQQIGGTSWSAPMWAGFCALINEARAKAQRPPLPFLNPLLYPLRGTPCFRDITQGSNGAFDSVSGYDTVTGLGVPNVKELIRELTK